MEEILVYNSTLLFMMGYKKTQNNLNIAREIHP